MQPRPHVYGFAHQMFPSLLRDYSPHVCADAFGPGCLRLLTSMWDHVGERLAPADRLPQPDFAPCQRMIAGRPSIVFAFGPPLHMTEPYFAALVANPSTSEPSSSVQSARYFVFEMTMAGEGVSAAVLGEWDSSKHINYGATSDTSLEGFIAFIERELAPRRPPPLQ